MAPGRADNLLALLAEWAANWFSSAATAGTAPIRESSRYTPTRRPPCRARSTASTCGLRRGGAGDKGSRTAEKERFFWEPAGNRTEEHRNPVWHNLLLRLGGLKLDYDGFGRLTRRQDKIAWCSILRMLMSSR